MGISWTGVTTVYVENNNSKVDASFSDVALSIRFHGMDIAHLQASPFEVCS
jgi:hypothetical protein